MSIRFALNGKGRVVSAEPGESLQVLLQRIGIPSVRCSDDGEGFTGSDTILFDGKAVLAGLMVAGQAEGHSLETIESLSSGSRLSVLQESMLDAGVVQSAFNTPGAALLLEELLRRKEAPTQEDVREALSGLFSRSTGYKQFFLAVELARKRRRDPAWSTAVAPVFRDGLRVIGKAARKIDGVKLVAGMKAYVEDRVEVGSCVLVMLRSPHAHAVIKSIDTTRAQALDGVVLVIDHRNCPDIAYGQAGQGFPEPSPYDYRMFSRAVRHVGDRVAAVVAEDAETARRAVSLITVEYDVIAPTLTLEEAMGGKRAPVHGDHLPGIVYQFSIGADAARNLAASASGGTGDVEEGLRAADAVIERTYSTSRVQCTPLEPHVVYTKMDGDRLIVHASTQVSWHLRRILARVLGMPENMIRVIKERIGGGYGSKQDVLLEEVCAFATVRTGRPVLYKYTREEEFIAATTRHPFRVKVTMGAKKDGTLTAIRMSVDADTGAYGQHCLTVPMNGCSKSLPLFRCPNMAWEVRAWYTNHVPSGAYQGYGAPQGSFAVQMAAAELADKLGMDLVAFLGRNHVREGDVLDILKSLGEGREGSAAHVRSCGLERALSQGSQSIGWGNPAVSSADVDPDLKLGKGVAIIQQGSGLPGLDQACADAKLLSDGTFLLSSGGADLGTGLDTVMAKIVAETLCCDLSKVAVISGDTDTTPFDKGAYASSGTYFSGNASLRAAQGLKERIVTVAGRMLGEPAEGLALQFPGRITGRSGSVDFAQIAHYCQGGEGPGELVAHASFTSDDAAIPYAAHFCEVAVNTRTGAVTVLRYHAVTDCGTPINPELAQGQVYGAVLKTIGHALYEEMIFDDQGRCLTTTLAGYGAPMIQELPRDLDASFVETDDPFGPFGGKSVSEISMNGAAPALAVAIHAATGAWLREWPMTPEKVLTALGRIS